MDGNLPIHRALYEGLTDVGEYDFLIELYPPNCLKVENNDEQLPLHIAASAGSIEVAELICTKYPIATQKLDRSGKSPIDVAVQREDHPMIKVLARICHNAFDMMHTCHDPIMKLLKESKFPKYRCELVSVLLRCSKNQKKKRNTMKTDQIAELKTKLETMKAGKEHAQIGLNDAKKRLAALMTEHNKK
jgi:ankyrin repeat protein